MTDSLQDLALMVKRLQMRHHRGANEALGPLGISLVQWDALRHLHRNPGASLHDLAVLTFQTDQSFGTLATRLITRGLIELRDLIFFASFIGFWLFLNTVILEHRKTD